MNSRIFQPMIEFIVNDSHYLVPSLLVKAFSSTIREKNNNEEIYTYKFENLIDPGGIFNLVVNLFYGQTIDINESNAFFLGYVGDILGIEPLSEATNSYRQIELTIDNIFDILGYLDTFHITYPKIIQFAGENWPLLSKSERSIQLTFFILNEIFSKNPQISADFDFVVKVIEGNSNFLDFSENENENENEINKNEFVLLFKYCDFSKLTSFQLDEIFEYVSFDSIPLQILEKFIQKVSIEKEIKSKKNDNFSISPEQGQIPAQEKNETANVKQQSSSNSIPNKTNQTQFKTATNSPSNSPLQLNQPKQNNNESTISSSNQQKQTKNSSVFHYSNQPKQNEKTSTVSSSNQPKQKNNESPFHYSNQSKQNVKSSPFHYSNPSKQNEKASTISSSNQTKQANNQSIPTSFTPLNLNQPKQVITQSTISSSNQQKQTNNQSIPTSFTPLNSNQPKQTNSQSTVSSSNQTKQTNNQSIPPSTSSQTNKSSNSSSSSEITIPSSGITGSRRSKPTPVLPLSGGSIDVPYENGYELRGVISIFQETPSLRPNLWKEEVDLIVPENTKEDFRYCLFDHSPRSWWCNYNGIECKLETAWIIVGFPNYKLELKYYTIASKGERINYSQPMSWKILGSDNRDSFDENDLVCYVKNAPAMNIPRPMRTFEVDRKSRPYSYFKFIMLKNFTTNQKNQGELILTGVEFFGTLTSKK